MPPFPPAWTAGRLPLSEIVRLPRNAKEHNLGEIVASICRFGYVESMVVNIQTGHLVHGHGRDEGLDYIKEHPRIILEYLPKYKKPDRFVPKGIEVGEDGDWLVPTFFADIAEGEEEALAIALNRTTESGGWNEQILAQVLSELAQRGGEPALRGTGFDLDDIDLLLKGLTFDPLPDLDENDQYALGRTDRILIRVTNVDALTEVATQVRELLADHPEWEAEIVD